MFSGSLYGNPFYLNQSSGLNGSPNQWNRIAQYLCLEILEKRNSGPFCVDHFQHVHIKSGYLTCPLNSRSIFFVTHSHGFDLKGLCHQLFIFLKAHTIKPVLYVHAQMVFKFLACLVQVWSFCLLLWNTYKLILKIVTKATSNLSSGFPLLLLVGFFQCTFIAGFRNSFQGYKTTFRDTGGY